MLIDDDAHFADSLELEPKLKSGKFECIRWSTSVEIIAVIHLKIDESSTEAATTKWRRVASKHQIKND
jgi:hypothetical protein